MDLKALTGALQARDIAAIKRLILDSREPALEEFRAGKIDGRALARALSELTDRQVTAMADHHLGRFRDKVALVFTGGNGRGEIQPFSDLDLMTLVPDPLPDGFEACYQDFYYTIMDAGFHKPGLSVRSPEECVGESMNDQTIWTSLLDRRYVWGDQALYARMDEAMDNLRAEAGEKLLAEKLAERGIRLGKMADSRYMLHPNVKEGRGGLRDYHAVLWIAQSVFGCKTMDALTAQGLCSKEEVSRIEEARDFLLATRSHLHDLTGRAEERLGAELLPDLVARHNQSRPHAAPETVESFMRQYFRHTREIGFFANIVSAAIEHRQRWTAPTRTTQDRFEISGNHIRFRGGIEKPDDMIAIFEAAHNNKCQLDYAALRAIRAHAFLIDDATRADPETGRRFLNILTSGENAAGLLRQMQETGLLQEYIPAFAHADMLMQFDPYHEYTVDEHTFRCIQEMYGLQSGDHEDKAPLPSKLFAAMSDKEREVLYTAIMLHDIGKGKGGRHELIGGEMAQELCPRLGLDEEQTAMVCWLVQHHLLLSDTAFRYDPYDPATIENFCARVLSEKHLDLLTILTTADIMGVGPGRWNWNKAAGISQLYENAKYYLAEQALKETPQSALPEDYRPGETRIDIGNDPHARVTVITVITPDRDRLFENLTGALSVMGGNIFDARIETAQGTAIDRFAIKNSAGEAYEPADFERLRKKLQAVLSGESPPDFDRDLGALSAKHLKKFKVYSLQPVINFNNAASRNSTVLEIEARDKPELLYQISRAFNDLGLDLRRAKITLYGHKAADTFYLRDRATGLKIDPARFEEIKKALESSPALNS